MSRAIPLDEVLAAQLADPEFRAEWERTAVARAVAEWLVRYRAGRDLTLRQLARQTSLSPSTLTTLEAGDRDPRVSTLLRLSRALGEPLVLDVDRTGDPADRETVVIGGHAVKAA